MRAFRRLLCGGLGVLCLSAHAEAQTLLLELDQARECLDRVDDLDGDGWPDLVTATASGAAVWSPVSGALLHRHDGLQVLDVVGGGDRTGDGRGDYAVVHDDAGVATVVIYCGAQGTAVEQHRHHHQVAFLGDLDGDGGSELALGPRLVVRSSRDGSAWFTRADLDTPRRLGDVDGDGFCDLAASSPQQPHSVVLSGADGQELWRSVSGHALHDAGHDLDGDGTPDLLVQRIANETFLGLCGRTGRTLCIVEAERGIQPRGNLLEDTDGDGLADVALSCARERDPQDAYRGATRLFSGVTGKRLYTFVRPTAQGRLGRGVTSLGDLDGDGVGELALAGARTCRVVRGATLWLDMWPRLDVTAGEVIQFTTSRGLAGSVALRFVIAVDGVPVWWNLDTRRLDDDGRRVKCVPLPPGVGSHDLDEIAFAYDHRGVLVATAVEVLELR